MESVLLVVERPVGCIPLAAAKGDGGLAWVATFDSRDSAKVTTVPLHINGEPRLSLSLDMKLRWSSSATYLRVDSSSIQVFADGRSEPLFRFDHEHDPHWKPTSYLHVHGHRDEVVHAMIAGEGRRQRERREPGRQHVGLSQLHFPVGGARFRPCLEDVLEFLVNEFGIDTHAGAIDAIHAGRRRWRERQLVATVSDHPVLAADALRDLGYEITAPPAAPLERADRLTQY